MKVFVAGATGVIGRQLVPMLVRAGHTVVGTTSHAARAALVRELGATPAVVDVLDLASVRTAVMELWPDAIVHQLTSLGGGDFAANNRLRITGTRNLVDAARDAGVRRLVAQSFCMYTPGAAPATEDDQLDVGSPAFGGAVSGVIALEQAVRELAEGVILRYGTLYGPDTWFSHGGMIGDLFRRGQMKLTEDITSFVHVYDAAAAAAEALAWPAGTVNIVDDEPAPGTVWMPAFASAIGAPVPQEMNGRQPAARAVSNARAHALGFTPRYRTWRAGFAFGLEELPHAAAVP